LCWRTANFGFRFDFSIMALRAIPNSYRMNHFGNGESGIREGTTVFPVSRFPASYCTITGFCSPRNGIPSSRSSANA
jgi:hypothetical protein